MHENIVRRFHALVNTNLANHGLNLRIADLPAVSHYQYFERHITRAIFRSLHDAWTELSPRRIFCQPGTYDCDCAVWMLESAVQHDCTVGDIMGQLLEEVRGWEVSARRGEGAAGGKG